MQSKIVISNNSVRNQTTVELDGDMYAQFAKYHNMNSVILFCKDCDGQLIHLNMDKKAVEAIRKFFESVEVV